MGSSPQSAPAMASNTAATAELPLKEGNVSPERTEYFQCLQSQQNLKF